MKKTFLIILVLCCSLLLIGCNKEKAKDTKDDTEKTEEKVKNKVVVEGDKVAIDGAEVTDLDVIAVQDVFNFSIIFDNSNNKEVKVDCSQISLKKGDDTYKLVYPDVKTISENQSYTQYGLPIKDSKKMKVGEEYEVYFGKTKIGIAKAIDR